VALLAAASVLGAAPAPGLEGAAQNGAAGLAASYSRQIVFLALAGEPWGYMGSKAFLWELQRGGVTVEGLDLALVDEVSDLGDRPG
jgi:nicastrin